MRYQQWLLNYAEGFLKHACGACNYSQVCFTVELNLDSPHSPVNSADSFILSSTSTSIDSS